MILRSEKAFSTKFSSPACIHFLKIKSSQCVMKKILNFSHSRIHSCTVIFLLMKWMMYLCSRESPHILWSTLWLHHDIEVLLLQEQISSCECRTSRHKEGSCNSVEVSNIYFYNNWIKSVRTELLTYEITLV